MITAKELRNQENGVGEDVKAHIEEIIIGAAKRGDDYATLDFSIFGDGWKDVDWLEQYGYKLTSNSPCLWWEVRWDE